MPDPDQQSRPQHLRVATSVLRLEATQWDEQGKQLKSISDKLAGMRFTDLEAFVFAPFINKHDSVVSYIKSRCEEGHREMPAIADTLRDVAREYDEREAEILAEIRRLAREMAQDRD